ncbi:MAG: aldo/keto reductase, partial [Almyronema sp.]
PSQAGTVGSGRLAMLADSGNPAFNKFTEKNWQIVAELEKVAQALERSMAQVAVNWVMNRPGVASVLMGATKLQQLQANLAALDFDLPAEPRQRLDDVSQPETRFPYTFFAPSLQGMINGGATVGDKPRSYYRPILGTGAGAGVTA